MPEGIVSRAAIEFRLPRAALNKHPLMQPPAKTIPVRKQDRRGCHSPRAGVWARSSLCRRLRQRRTTPWPRRSRSSNRTPCGPSLIKTISENAEAPQRSPLDRKNPNSLADRNGRPDPLRVIAAAKKSPGRRRRSAKNSPAGTAAISMFRTQAMVDLLREPLLRVLTTRDASGFGRIRRLSLSKTKVKNKSNDH